MTGWTASDIPPQHGRTAVVTGTGGLGFEDALALARSGGDVILAGRNPRKGADAVEGSSDGAAGDHQLRAAGSRQPEIGRRVRKAHHQRAAKHRHPHQQCGRHGATEARRDRRWFRTAVRHQLPGPFCADRTSAAAPAQRQFAARCNAIEYRRAWGAINFEDLNAEQDYKPMPVYSQSKLACLMFALELDRRSKKNGWGVSSIAAHPGISRTDLLLNAPGKFSFERIMRTLLPFMFQPAAQGALPALFAATAPEAEAGAYYGPDKMGEARGHPAAAKIPATALDEAVAERLWQCSEELTGISFSEATTERTQALV